MSLRNVSSSASRSLSRPLPEDADAALGELIGAGESTAGGGSCFSGLGLDAAIVAEVGGVVSVTVGRGEDSAGEACDCTVIVGVLGVWPGSGGGGSVLGVATAVDVESDVAADGGSPTTMTDPGGSYAAVGPTAEDGVPPTNDVSPVIERGSEGSRTRNSRLGAKVAPLTFSCRTGET